MSKDLRNVRDSFHSRATKIFHECINISLGSENNDLENNQNEILYFSPQEEHIRESIKDSLSNKFKILNVLFFIEGESRISSIYDNDLVLTKLNNNQKKIKPFILIVDDNDIINQSNKKIVKEILHEYKIDLDIIIANDGYDIIRIALNNELDYQLMKCIITDENMDYMSGSEAIRFLRTFEKMKNLSLCKIISLTCHEDTNILNNIYKSGADDIVTKPISKNEMKKIFEKIDLRDF